MYSGFAATLKASHRRKKMAKRKTDDSLTLTQQQTISTTITYYDLQDWGITSASLDLLHFKPVLTSSTSRSGPNQPTSSTSQINGFVPTSASLDLPLLQASFNILNFKVWSEQTNLFNTPHLNGFFPQ